MTRFGVESCSGSGEVEVPDVYGALRGIRSFKLDTETGHLTGVIFPIHWTDGVMEAQCLQAACEAHFLSDEHMLRMVPKSNNTVRGYDYVDGRPVLKAEHYRPAECPGIARGNHGCGFYAHHGDTLPGHYYTAGVVEMFGKVELGPKGLRSSKARIIALVRPEAFGTRPENIRVNGNLIGDYEATLSRLLDEPPAGDAHPESKTAWKAKVEQITRRLLTAQQRERQAVEDLQMFDAKTRWLYPSVPVFHSMESMLTEFPVEPLDHLFEETS